MTIGVYKITNVKNNKCYIGSSKNIETRWNQHKLKLNKDSHHSYKLQRDWKEFGENNFLFEIIDEVPEEQLKEYEQYWIDTIQPHKTGYNILNVADVKSKKTDVQKWNDENGGFVFLLFRYNKILYGDINEIVQEDIFKLFYISTFLNYDNYLTIKRKEMKEVLFLSRERFDQFFNKMKRLGIIIQNENKLLSINKEYLSKGVLDKYTKQYNDFTRIYINSMKYLYENLPTRKHGQIGALLKLIPFAHRETNIFCSNPIEDFSDTILLTKRDLNNILNYHRNGVHRLLNDLSEIYLVEKQIIYFDDKNIVINPRLMYGGSFKENYLLKL